ncbi:hypothetical protein SKAU_G00284900 [Synaphobranchus kaupii]|uniref:DUF5641 domain-containing protein n=1 Tax=Synaphobranchus kaupii TaxID=118154 RepID=A0A9Q1EXS8_SYNKA|nr:hypothetical protein SKAU_G00284900 [Synaphobranchus kaupii]
MKREGVQLLNAFSIDKVLSLSHCPVLIEVEGILNAKPLGYVSSDITDPDLITPNLLLMRRPDGSLPQVVYPDTEILSRRQWKHSQILNNRFWSHFVKHYLPSLQTHSTWQADKEDITAGSSHAGRPPATKGPLDYWQSHQGVPESRRTREGSRGAVQKSDLHKTCCTHDHPPSHTRR